jgi:hypothetical protein
MKNSRMKNHGLNRRQFIQSSALLAGSTLLSPWAISNLRAAATPAGKRTAVDQVTLGKTAIKLSRLGFGTGSNNGREQTALGRDGFNKLIRYAYDQASPTLTPRNPTALLSGSVTRSKDCRARNYLFSPRWTASRPMCWP